VGGRRILVGSARWMREHHVDYTDAELTLARHRAARVSTLLVAVDGKLAGTLGHADRPRPESADVVRALQANGRRRVVLLSGDSRATVEAVSRFLPVDEARGEMLPEEKADYVRRMQREGHVVAMVGDGINDAPALALADVGISLGGSTDVALETADVVLLEGGLTRLQLAFATGDQAMRSVRIGLGIVIVPNAIAIALGALGLLGPALAALINNGSTVAAAIAAASPLLRSERSTQGGRTP
jgi:Cu2+-exporting ATPase